MRFSSSTFICKFNSSFTILQNREKPNIYMNRLFAKSQSHEAVTSQHLTEELEQKSTNQVTKSIVF